MKSDSKLFLTVNSTRYLKQYRYSLIPRYVLWSSVQTKTERYAVNILKTNSKSELYVKMAVWGMKLGNVAEKYHRTILINGKLTKCNFRARLEVKRLGEDECWT